MSLRSKPLEIIVNRGGMGALGTGQLGAQAGLARSEFVGVSAECLTLNCYILYRPRSSSFRPSSHLRRSSEEIRSAVVLATLEVLSTSSSTKIGQSRRKANASA